MDGGDVTCFGTGPVALVDETQELADFIKGKTELARPQDEAKPSLMRGVVAPVREQPN